jgi:pyrroline-5-carboxylate reductase
MNKNIGFIGCGNMGQAMMGGIIQSGLVQPNQMMVADLFEPNLKKVSEAYKIGTTKDNREVAEKADILFLAVKPNIYNIVMEGIKDLVTKDMIIVTIAAGKTIADVESVLGEDKKIVRTMPNTPALVGEGMAAICPNKNVSEEELAQVVQIYESFGKAEVVKESLIDAVIGVSGSSPAYVFMFIEAMADGAVMAGLPRNQAYKMAAQAVLGSAKMVLESGKHPGELKDMVCSPGGTTIEAVAALEKEGLRSAVIEGVRQCIEKSIKMSQTNK